MKCVEKISTAKESMRITGSIRDMALKRISWIYEGVSKPLRFQLPYEELSL